MEHGQTLIKICNHTKRREDSYLTVKELIVTTSISDVAMFMMTSKTDILLDCFLHIGGDASKLENEKRVTVAHALMHEKVIKSLINKTAEEKLTGTKYGLVTGGK